MNYLNPTNKLLIFIGWWVNYPQFFKGNLEKTLLFKLIYYIKNNTILTSTKNKMTEFTNMLVKKLMLIA